MILQNTGEWHLEKKVTISIIVALLMNAGASVWWASRLDATVSRHETQIADNTRGIERLTSQNTSLLERLARIEESQKYSLEVVKEIRDAVKSK